MRINFHNQYKSLLYMTWYGCLKIDDLLKGWVLKLSPIASTFREKFLYFNYNMFSVCVFSQYCQMGSDPVHD